MKNIVRGSAHFPCDSKEGNHVLGTGTFESGTAPKVYWADVPEGDYLSGADLTASYTVPINFPEPGKVARLPRVVRLIMPEHINPSVGNTSFVTFANSVKSAIQDISKSIYFQLFLYPYDPWIGLIARDNTSFEATVTIGGGTQNTEISNLNIGYLDAQCMFYSDTLSFFTVAGTAVELAGNYNTSANELIGPSTGWATQFLPYWELQYERMPRAKVIVQNAWEAYSSLGVQDPNGLVDDNSLKRSTYLFCNNFENMGPPSGWEVGDDFDFDVDYITDTIRSHWRL